VFFIHWLLTQHCAHTFHKRTLSSFDSKSCRKVRILKPAQKPHIHPKEKPTKWQEKSQIGRENCPSANPLSNSPLSSDDNHMYFRSVFSNFAHLDHKADWREEKYLSFKTSFHFVEFSKLVEVFIIKGIQP